MKTFKALIAVLLYIFTLSACGDVAPISADTTTTASITEATTSEVTIIETTTTVSVTQETTTTKTLETEATTTVPETEATTASVTTADNSSDTRSTQQKLDDIIAANPDVEIGYALVEADYNRDYYNALFSFKPDSKIPYTDIEDFDIIIDSLRFGIVDRQEVFMDEHHIGPEDTVNLDSEMCRLYREEGKWDFRFKEVVNYLLQGDTEAKALLKELYSYTKGDNETIESFYKMWGRVSADIDAWHEMEYKKENAPYLIELLSNTDRNAFFYEGTGVVVAHWGNTNTDTGTVLDSGLITINDKDYVFVILTRSEWGHLRTDLVSDISRILYESI
jgi:hypothetical protein